MLSGILAVGIGALIGLALGLLGGGGSILTVPALVYLLGQPPQAAVTTSLVIVGTNALLGAGLHARQGHVRWPAALLFGAVGTGAAYGGARLSHLVPGPVLLVLFALLMIAIAGLMLRGPVAARPGTARAWPRVVAGGLGVGFLPGFLGVGGGFVIVPALVLLLGMDMREAVGSSLLVIALNSAAGLAGHWQDSGLNAPLIALLVGGGALGLLLGSRLLRRLPAARVRQAFAVFVLLLGLTLLILNLPVVLG
jgi:uncharacterized membrane protein YfcA